MAKGKLLIFRSKAEREQEQKEIDLTPYIADDKYTTGLSDLFSPEEIEQIRADLEREDDS